MTSRRRTALLVAEAQRRRRDPVAALRSMAFQLQLDFIDDPSRYKAACCARRCGKTYAIGIYVLSEALTHAKSNILYLALTREMAQRVAVKDIFLELLNRLGFQDGKDYRLNKAALSLEFNNGSIVYISGCDVAERQHHKFEGNKYRLVVIDEAQHWKTSLYRLIEESLAPAMSDVQGTTCLIGVPDNARAFFYDVTTGQKDPRTGLTKHPGWSVHRWKALDNPHQAKQWQLDVDRKLKDNPLFKDTVVYQQKWLGEWVIDPNSQCYRFDDERNRVSELPGEPAAFTWYLGVDVGYSPDPMAFVVCGHRADNSDPTLYVVHASKHKEMMLDQVKEQVDLLNARWPISCYVIDGANGNVVAELTKRLQIPFEKAEKVRKFDFINMMSDDLVAARVKAVGDEADDLTREWKELVWDRSEPARPKEHSALENHCCDAALYAWRRALHYARPAAGARTVGYHQDGWSEEREKRLVQEAQARFNGDDGLDGFLR